MYQGRTVTASNHTTDHKKKNVTLKSLGIGNKSVSEMNAKSTSTCMYLFCIQLNVHEAASHCNLWPVIKVVQCIVLRTAIEWPTFIMATCWYPEVSCFMKVLPCHLQPMILMDLQEDESATKLVSSKYTMYILTDTDTMQTPCSVAVLPHAQRNFLFNNKQTVANNQF